MHPSKRAQCNKRRRTTGLAGRRSVCAEGHRGNGGANGVSLGKTQSLVKSGSISQGMGLGRANCGAPVHILNCRRRGYNHICPPSPSAQSQRRQSTTLRETRCGMARGDEASVGALNLQLSPHAFCALHHAALYCLPIEQTQGSPRMWAERV